MNEIKRIEEHIFGASAPADALLFEAMLILDSGLQEHVMWQKKTHEILVQYSRKQLKAEIGAVHDQLFVKSKYWTFRQRILSLFK